MKLKCFFALSLLACSAGTTYAQSAGSFILGAGWNHFMPRSGGNAITEGTLNGSPVPDTYGMRLNVDKASAAGFTGTYFITDNVAGEFFFNTPARISFTAADNSGNFGKLASVKQWSPALLVKYYFGEASATLRPFVGAGISYTWFNGARVHPILANSSGTFSLQNKWAPVVTGGLSYQFDEHWFASASVSYMPLRTTATYIERANDGSDISTAKGKIKLDPIATLLNVGYRF